MKTIFDPAPFPRYISHRGFTPMAPENSLPGFEYAGLLSQWAIETDVRITQDGELVCCHDADVSRMFGEAGCVEDMTLAEIEKLRLSRGNRLECFADEQKKMPLFSQYLAVCRRFGCVPFIELKTPEVERVLRAVRAAGFADEEVVMSAIPKDWLVETRKHTKAMFIHWIFAREEELEEFARLENAGVSINIPDAFSCPKEKSDAVHALGLKICLRAGDTDDQVKRMQALNLDYIPTNCMHLPLGR
ncbi:MAG: hypothetical protein IKV90_09195 [Clostridia bacterium]|nr:hypothetical protein [Clostridia bacterium]